MFKVNEGLIDRIIRLVLAIVFLIVGFLLKGGWLIFFWILSFILFITSLFGFCGIYALLGINTCAMKKKIK